MRPGGVNFCIGRWPGSVVCEGERQIRSLTLLEQVNASRLRYLR